MGTREVSSSDDLDTNVSYQGFADELLPDEALVYLRPLDYGVDSAPQLTPALAPAGLPALEQNSSVTTSFADMATQEVSSSVNTHISHQALAGEAFAYFLPLDNEVDSTPQLPPALPSAGLSAPGPNSSVTTAPYTSSYAAVPPLLCPAIPPGLQLPAQQFFPAAPAQQPPPPPPAPPLPSLLQYTDTILMRTTHLHNNPPDSIRACISCRSVPVQHFIQDSTIH